MKVSTAAIVLSLGGVSAWNQPSRSSIRNLGQKNVVIKGPSRVNGNTMKMEGAFSFSFSLCCVLKSIGGASRLD